MPKRVSRGASASKKGHEFEKRVARWARKKFDGETETNILMYGRRVKRPYEIDVHVETGWIFKNHLWLECKTIKSRIKRTHIFRICSAAEDIQDAYEDGKEEFHFDRLGFVATSGFDVDALSVAEDKEVACIHYTGRRYHLLNEVEWWPE